MFSTILFFIFGGVLVCAALGVILARNPVHSALLLVLCFFNSAVIWLMLDAEFLGIVLVLVYVGAVMVLFLFVVMMLDVDVERIRTELAGYWPLTVAVAGFVGVRDRQRDRGAASRRRDLQDGGCAARGLFQHARLGYGAVHPLRLSRPAGGDHPAGGERGGHHSHTAPPPRESSRRTSQQQVAVRARDRVRIVKMASEKRS